MKLHYLLRGLTSTTAQSRMKQGLQLLPLYSTRPGNVIDVTHYRLSKNDITSF